MTRTNQHISIVKGDDHEATFAIKDSADDPKTMSAATSLIWKAIKIGAGSPSITKELAAGITLVDVAGSSDGVKVTLTPADTNIAAGSYRHELETVIGGKRSTLATGMLTIKEDIINN